MSYLIIFLIVNISSKILLINLFINRLNTYKSAQIYLWISNILVFNFNQPSCKEYLYYCHQVTFNNSLIRINCTYNVYTNRQNIIS